MSGIIATRVLAPRAAFVAYALTRLTSPRVMRIS
jgi:hypothetical protein